MPDLFRVPGCWMERREGDRDDGTRALVGHAPAPGSRPRDPPPSFAAEEFRICTYMLPIQEELTKFFSDNTGVQVKTLGISGGEMRVRIQAERPNIGALSDRIMVMDHGRILQAGTPREIYERSAFAGHGGRSPSIR